VRLIATKTVLEEISHRDLQGQKDKPIPGKHLTPFMRAKVTQLVALLVVGLFSPEVGFDVVVSDRLIL
jgi:hypothetical protein